jgi:YHS domain-containing protein
MAYKHTNSKGVTYYLNSKDVTLRGGKQQTIYYFSKDERPETVNELPAGYTVNENPRNGFLTLKRK